MLDTEWEPWLRQWKANNVRCECGRLRKCETGVLERALTRRLHRENVVWRKEWCVALTLFNKVSSSIYIIEQVYHAGALLAVLIQK